MHLLIIEDDPALQEVLQIIGQEELGATIHCSPSGEYALTLLATDPPDLILVDFTLQGKINGGDVLLLVHEHWPTIPTILFSATHRPPAVEALASAVLYKPFDIDQLLEMIQRLCKPAAITVS